MYLKNIKALGFKSFADRTRLELEPGVTVIVGPNGSGKSNIVDALAWVMGTQATKQLRTSKMEDLIFSGTSNRPAQNRAEVVVTFDNSDGRLPLDLSEVTLTRRLLRDGTSEYEINGTGCRLLDISDLLSDGNVGRNQHVIVNQGQVTEILNSSAEQHRAVIEEAAGVLKHRVRRQRAERRLERTGVDLARLNDIQRELRRQMRPLARQAKAAERYVELRDRARALRLYVGGQNLISITTRSGEVEGLRKEFAAVITSNATELGNLEALIDRLSIETGDVSRALQLDTAAAARLETTRERLNRIASVAGERSRSLFAGYEQRDDRLRDLAEEAAALEAELSSIRDEERQAQGSVDRTEVALKALEDEERSLAEQELMPEEGVVANLRGDLAALEAAEQRDTAEAAALQSRVAELDIAAENHQTSTEVLNQEIRTVQKAISESKRASVEQARASRGRAEQLQQAIEHEQGLRLALAALTAKLDVLAGSSAATAQTRDRLVSEGTAEGVLVEMLGVPTDLTASVAAALGPWADSLVLSSIDRVIDRVKDLDDPGYDGLSFVSNPPSVANVAYEPCSLPFLAGLLAASSIPPSLTAALFGDVVVAEDRTSATEVAANRPDLRVVTRNGDLVTASGIAFGAVSGPLAIASVESEIAVIEAQLADAEADTTIRRQALEVATQDAQAAIDEIQRLLTQRNELQFASEQTSRSIQDEALEMERLMVRQAALTEASVHRSSRLTDLRTRLQALEGEEAERQAVWEALTARRNQVATHRDEARIARQAAAADLASLKERHRIMTERSGAIQQESARLSSIDITSNEPERLVEIEDAAREAIAGIGGHLEVLRDRQRINRDLAGDSGLRLEESRKRKSELDRQSSEAKEQDSTLAVEAEGLRVRLEAVGEGLRRDLDASEEQAMAAPMPVLGEGVDPETYDWNAELDQKEAELRRIGPVNPLAADEFAALEERSTFQADQITDLENSAAELRKVITALDDTMADLFRSAFTDIARYYEENFEMLFPGGRGRLRLEDPDNLLETGVVIDAQPAGKKLRRLSLLSGGERTLAALAFLFAVFRARPSPFYVLDEVEAALDDANLRRFLRLVDALRENSQVLIITHQQQTMEVADILYGVTMEPGGSSKVIAKRLRDITPADLEPAPDLGSFSEVGAPGSEEDLVPSST